MAENIWARFGGTKFTITVLGLILFAAGGHHAIVTKQIDAIGAMALGIGGMVAAFNGSNFGTTWSSSKYGPSKPTDPTTPGDPPPPRPTGAMPRQSASMPRVRDD